MAVGLTTGNWLPATAFQRAFQARTLGAACEDTTTPSSQFSHTAPDPANARAQVTLGRDDAALMLVFVLGVGMQVRMRVRQRPVGVPMGMHEIRTQQQFVVRQNL